jgi:hypothetical protein
VAAERAADPKAAVRMDAVVASSLVDSLHRLIIDD